MCVAPQRITDDTARMKTTIVFWSLMRLPKVTSFPVLSKTVRAAAVASSSCEGAAVGEAMVRGRWKAAARL